MTFTTSFKRVVLRGLGVIALTFSASANAGLILNDSGQLLGATDVNVQGILYDVEFVNGTCADIFSGCDHPLDFAFSDLDSVRAAGHALLDQVFLDGAGYSFDSYPTTVAACAANNPELVPLTTSVCWVHTPFSRYGFLPDGTPGRLLLYDTTMNTGSDHIDMDWVIGAGPGGREVLPSTGTEYPMTWARWTQPTSVPEPSTLALLACALAGIALVRRQPKAE